MIQHVGVDLNRVVCTVSAGWPDFYFDLGAKHVTAVDVNWHQIRYYLQHPQMRARQFYNSGQLKVIYGDLLDVSERLGFQQATLIDLSNILDYVDGDWCKELNPILSALHPGAYLLMSSLYAFSFHDLIETLSKLNNLNLFTNWINGLSGFKIQGWDYLLIQKKLEC